MPDKETLTAVMNTYGVSDSAVNALTNHAATAGSPSGGMGFSIVNLFIGMLFGIFGMYAFNNGRKEKNYKHLVLGIALMAYPYFILDNTWLIAIVGIGLTAAIFLWKD